MKKGFIQTWIIIITTFFSGIFISHPPITNIIVATSTVQEESTTTIIKINQEIKMEEPKIKATSTDNKIIDAEYIEATSTLSQSPVEDLKKAIEIPTATTTATTTKIINNDLNIEKKVEGIIIPKKFESKQYNVVSA